MKKLTYKNHLARNYPEFCRASWENLFFCQSPLAVTECKESTADRLQKTIKILNQKWVDVLIEYEAEKPLHNKLGWIKVTMKREHYKETREFLQWIHKIHDLEFYFLDQLLAFS